jgi:hypothetical protein
MYPESRGSLASWAAVVAAAVRPLAAVDLDAAVEVAGWPADPCERLIACAALVAPLTSAGDFRSALALEAVGRAAVDLPRYRSEIDLTPVPQGPAVAYLDPAVRARWEAALLLPPEDEATADALVGRPWAWRRRG